MGIFGRKKGPKWRKEVRTHCPRCGRHVTLGHGAFKERIVTGSEWRELWYGGRNRVCPNPKCGKPLYVRAIWDGKTITYTPEYAHEKKKRPKK